jgi:hypothetical protein
MLNNPVMGVMTLKKTLILAAAASAITINQDDNGVALNLKRAELYIYTPAIAAASSFYGRINDIATANYYYGATASATTYLFVAHGNTLFGLSRSTINVIGGQVVVILSSETAASSGAAGTFGVNSALYNQGVEAILSLYFFKSGYDFPAGTIIELWGVDA